MLRRAERFKILKYIRYCCTVGCLPAVVDYSNWQLLRPSKRRRWLSRAYFALFLLHCVYKFWTLLIVCFVQKNTSPLHQLIIHATLALGSPIMIFWYYQMYIEHAGTFRGFLHMTLTGNIGGTTAIAGKETKNWGNHLKAYTLQELLALNMPYFAVLVTCIIIGVGINDPTLPLLLYAGLPEQLQSWLSFTVLLLEEIRFMLIVCAIAVPMWILQPMSFDLLNNQLKHLIHSIERATSRQKLLSTYKKFRHIQLHLTIINNVNRYVIFSSKILCIGMSITAGYAAIAHFSQYPIFGILYYVLLFEGMFVYIVSYDKAFGIPELFKEATQRALLRCCLGRHVNLSLFKRQMRAIPLVGIKVGDFHVLERQSTPVFVHYVVTNIVSMLVAYKR